MPLIPGQNPLAMIAYYLGIFSLIPFFGCALGLPALICGIIGMVKANANPEIGGKGHALTGIVLGVVGPFVVLGALWGVSILTSIR